MILIYKKKPKATTKHKKIPTKHTTTKKNQNKKIGKPQLYIRLYRNSYNNLEYKSNYRNALDITQQISC